MDIRLVALGWIVVAYFLYLKVSAFILKRRHAAAPARAGCLPPPVLPTVGIWNYTRVTDALKADKAKQFPEFAIARYASMGNRTHAYQVLGHKGVMTCDPKNVQAILATQFNDFGIGSLRSAYMNTLLGRGIFTTDGKMWQHSRTMLRPQFARDQVSDLEMEEEHVKELMQAIPLREDGWTSETDLQILFFRLTLDSATEFLFGESVESQIHNLPQNADLAKSGKASWTTEFARAFDDGQNTLARKSRFMTKHWMYDSFAYQRDRKIVREFADHFVSKALASTQSEKKASKNGRERYVFLDALIEQTRDPIELRSQSLNILLAGRDTTASLLGWVFYILARHPDHFNRLRKVILEDFGPYSKPSISFEKIKSCQTLQNILNETLRLYPVVPVNTRQALIDTTIPRGGGPDSAAPIFIPKGTSVDYSVHVMHRLKSIWGEDADDFKPSRWIGKKPGWEYLPFNGGPRICLGQQFAITEASYVIIRLLQRFDKLENLDERVEPTHNLSLTSCPGHGVRVRLHEAEKV